MNIAVLSDVHSNIDALNAVLDDTSKFNIDKYIVAGDLTGYFYHPDECVQIVRDLDPEIIQGNHDRWESQLRDVTAKVNALEENRFFLGMLPDHRVVDVDGRNIFVCHGSPKDRMGYVYPDAPKHLLNNCRVKGCDIVVMGHTHYAFAKLMITKRKNYLLINPGSVGQPRDGGYPSWILLKTEEMIASIRRVKYNVDKVIAEVKKNDPYDLYLEMVLRRCTNSHRV